MSLVQVKARGWLAQFLAAARSKSLQGGHRRDRGRPARSDLRTVGTQDDKPRHYLMLLCGALCMLMRGTRKLDIAITQFMSRESFPFVA